MRVRQANAADIPAMLGLERATPTAAHWPHKQYEDLFVSGDASSQRFAWVVETELLASRNSERHSKIVGFLIAHQIHPEWELENIVVDEEFRRKGCGKLLLNRLVSEARLTRGASIFLEVRESNFVARSFYEEHGFQKLGSRQNYYKNPCENAVLYRFDFG